MKPSDQLFQASAADSERRKGEVLTRPGGYHSRGVPGEEGEVRKRMRVLKVKVGDRSQRIINSRPLSGGAGAEHASAAQLENGLRETGSRLRAHRPDPAGENDAPTVFVIARKGVDVLDTPVLHAGESNDEEAIVLFTNRQTAQQYLDLSGWNQTNEIGELSPNNLLQWLVESAENGIGYVTINPDREQHLAGQPQPVLALDALGDKSPNSLFQEVTVLART